MGLANLLCLSFFSCIEHMVWKKQRTLNTKNMLYLDTLTMFYLR